MFEPKMKKGKPMPGGGQQDRRHICIEIPALTQAVQDIIAYFNTRDSQQKQIDALTAQVTELTDRLSSSTSDLQESVDANKP